jgi:hypothetical protein
LEKTTFKSTSSFTTTFHFEALKGEEITEKKGRIRDKVREKKERKYIEINKIPRIELKRKL